MPSNDENGNAQNEIGQELARRENLAKEILETLEEILLKLDIEDQSLGESDASTRARIISLIKGQSLEELQETEMPGGYRNLLINAMAALDEAKRVIEALQDYNSTEEVTKEVLEKARLRDISPLN